MTNSFREKLENTDDFLLTFELVPGMTVKGTNAQKVLSFARQAKAEGLLDALTITDNPGGNPALSPDVLGGDIKETGIEPIVHFACRDWNRYGAFSRALQLSRLSIENLLVVTGDYPAQGLEGTAKPCFDLDSATMLCMLNGLNHGAEMSCENQGKSIPEKTNFFLGAAVSCFKHAESETINQYYKLLKKIHNGAKFAITQICYDARKFHELLQFLRDSNCEIPVLGSVYVPSPRAVRFMNRGGVPGVFVPQKMLEQIQSEAKGPDKGKSASLTRAAKLIAVLKGLGYRGAHLAGPPTYEDIRTIILQFRNIKSQWRDFLPEFDFGYPGGFYLYRKDPATGLNTAELAKLSRSSLRSCTAHTIMKAFHWLLFNKKVWHYPLIKRMARFIDRHKILTRIFYSSESLAKSILFDCQKCGDCALDDMTYLCPESQCPKFIRNGPCGGSQKTRCEVRKDRPCVWVKVYERLKAHNQLPQLKSHCLPPRNWTLDKMPSWLNFHLDRDYHAAALPFCERMKQKP